MFIAEAFFDKIGTHMRQISKSKRLMPFLVTVGFMLYGFGGMFIRLQQVFSNPQEDMSFGWLVPIFSIYVLWTSRHDLKKSVGLPSVWGLLACLPCMAVALLGTRGLQVRMEQVGFVGLCVAIPWAFFGWRTAKLCFFPAIFLLFTVPLSTFLDTVTIHLRLLASGTAFMALKGFGVEAVQQGTAIISQGEHPFNIDVAEPCSGLRSLFALMALTAAYAWHTQTTWLRRFLLFACEYIANHTIIHIIPLRYEKINICNSIFIYIVFFYNKTSCRLRGSP